MSQSASSSSSSSSDNDDLDTGFEKLMATVGAWRSASDTAPRRRRDECNLPESG